MPFPVGSGRPARGVMDVRWRMDLIEVQACTASRRYVVVTPSFEPYDRVVATGPTDEVANTESAPPVPSHRGPGDTIAFSLDQPRLITALAPGSECVRASTRRPAREIIHRWRILSPIHSNEGSSFRRLGDAVHPSASLLRALRHSMPPGLPLTPALGSARVPLMAGPPLPTVDTGCRGAKWGANGHEPLRTLADVYGQRPL